jgi:hypothetical protein
MGNLDWSKGIQAPCNERRLTSRALVLIWRGLAVFFFLNWMKRLFLVIENENRSDLARSSFVDVEI